jgi:hypothetical protein
MTDIDIEKLEAAIIFNSRPEAIPGDLRPLWRICIILLILYLSARGQKSTLSRIHIINWAIRTKENRDSLRLTLKGDVPPDAAVVRIEPSLNRAIDFALGEGLVENISGRSIHLTLKGLDIASKLMEQSDLFIEEKIFLKELGGNMLTEQVIKNLLSER